MDDADGRVDFGRILAEVEGLFDPDELAALSAINADPAPDPDPADETAVKFRLLNLVTSWGYYVRVMVSQVDRAYDEPDPTILGAYDLVGSLFTRDRVERAAAQVPDALTGRVGDLIEVFDAEYHAFTVDDVGDEVTAIGDVRRFRAGWWWHRVPARGPVRQELDVCAPARDATRAAR